MTPAQERVYAAVRAFTERTWVAPTVRELTDECGFGSPNATNEHIERMERDGWLYVYRPDRGPSAPCRIVCCGE